MAKLSAHGETIGRYLDCRTGLVHAVCSDGRVLRKSIGQGYKLWKKCKPGVDPARIAEHFDTEHFMLKNGTQPSDATLRKMALDLIPCETPDGCEVEPDGTCTHGYKSWLLLTCRI